jgi:hypothetical protein
MMMMDVDKLTCDPSDAVDLLALADRYGIDELKRACAAMIEAYYDFEAAPDCLNVLDVALRYSAADLVRTCLTVINSDVSCWSENTTIYFFRSWRFTFDSLRGSK